MNHLEELQDTIRRLHGSDSEYVGSVPVIEKFEGATVWDGVVEVFDLKNHPTAFRVYAWAHDTDDPKHPRRHVTVLHKHPINSAHDAVRVALMKEFKNLGTAEES